MNCAIAFPRVAVLLATYNGAKWLQDQINSILAQVGVTVTIFVSDDGSSDGSSHIIHELSLLDRRIILLPAIASTGSAGQNFYRLIRDVDVDSFDYVGFSDQDDIWFHDKLATQINLIKKNHADAVSSNVIAFWPNGTEHLIVKSQRQRSYDFIFESAGPGCTFLMRPWVVARVRQQLLNELSQARQVELHDWLVYAIARSCGAEWVIDSKPLLKYRQHQANVVGANVGICAKWSRFLKVRKGWYRGQVAKVSQMSALICLDPKVQLINRLANNNSILSNFRMLSIVNQARRSFLGRLGLLFLLITFTF